jgi:hypothetical protein
MKPVYPYGMAPRKFRVSGPPAQYPEGPAGDIHRERAIRRLNRWRIANADKSDAAMPRHIWNNFADATNQMGGATS